MLEQYSPARPPRRLRAAVALAVGLSALCILPWRLAAQNATPATSKPTRATEQDIAIVEAKPAPVRATKPAQAARRIKATVSPTAASAPAAVTVTQAKPAQATPTAAVAKPGEEATQPATLPTVKAATAPPADPNAIEAKPAARAQNLPLTSVADPANVQAKPASPADPAIVSPIAKPGIAVPRSANTKPMAVSVADPALPAASTPATAFQEAPARAPSGQNRLGHVSLHLKDATFYDALTSMLTQAGVDFRIDDDVARIARSSKTTISFSNVPIEKALGMLLRSTRTLPQSLTYVKEDGLYIIVPFRGDGKGIPILEDIPLLGRLFRKAGAPRQRHRQPTGSRAASLRSCRNRARPKRR